jgi:hypothetical protein
MFDDQFAVFSKDHVLASSSHTLHPCASWQLPAAGVLPLCFPSCLICLGLIALRFAIAKRVLSRSVQVTVAAALPHPRFIYLLTLQTHRHGVAGGQRGEEDDGRSSTCASPSAVLKRRWVSSKRANNDATATGGVKGYLDVDHQPRVCVAKGFGA